LGFGIAELRRFEDCFTQQVDKSAGVPERSDSVMDLSSGISVN